MNGTGWVCDNCGIMRVTPGFGDQLRRFEPCPPHGWYILYGPMDPQVDREQKVAHLCSFGCVGEYQHKRLTS